ncbi:MAG: hypothetical protein MUD01_10450 [Chloroflexaceae bacterium]|jgi:transcription termination factor Rho|nr:hypothetical protein [Chloroflexaceae bacterium]
MSASTLPTFSGTLVVVPEGYGFLRQNPEQATPEDVLVMRVVVSRYCLQPGDTLTVSYHLPQHHGEVRRYVARVLQINGHIV